MAVAPRILASALPVLPLLCILGADPAFASAVDWTHMPHTSPWSSGVGWNSFHYDTLKHRILFMGIEPNEGNDIYAHTLWAYDPPTNQMTRLGGAVNNLGLLPDQNTCPQSVTPPGQPWADDTPSWPGPRHPYHQMAWDNRRNRLWLMGGVCGGYDYADTYFYDSEAEGWTQVQPAHFPTYRIGKAMIYDPDTDALFVYGYDGGASTHDSWIYCPSDGSGGPTPAQSAAGCQTTDDWFEVLLQNGVVDINGTDVTWVSGAHFDPAWQLNLIFIGAADVGTNYPLASVVDATHLTLGVGLGVQHGVPYHVQPPGWSQPGMVYDLPTKKAILFGGGTNQTWSYDVLAKQWTDRHPANPPPHDPYFPEPTLAYDPTLARVLFHQRTGAGGPSDWSYDPPSNTWTQIASGGGWYATEAQALLSPLSTPQVMVVDPVNNVLVGWNSGVELWQGRLGPVNPIVPDVGTQPDGGVASDPSQRPLGFIFGGCGGCSASGGGTGLLALGLLAFVGRRARSGSRPPGL